MKKVTKRICIALLIAALALCAVGCGGGSSRRSNNSSSDRGFVGSDGEYHSYIPEFGDDVNDWMKNNW